MLDRAQKGLSFPLHAVMKVYSTIDSLLKGQPGFYQFVKFLTILYELSICDDARTLSSSSFARSKTASDSRRVQKVEEYINLHYTENLTLDFLCNRFYISKFYLSRSFENATGKSIYQYVLEKRMIIARQLLISGEKPTDIFSLCGFGQYSNFYRAFKKYYHMSPMTFLKKMNYEEKNE